MTVEDLAGLAARVDAERYVENPVLAPVITDLLAEDSPTRILFLHGPGGIGKSTTLRAAARQARDHHVHALDGRGLGAEVLPDDLIPRIEQPILLVVDEADALGGTLHRLGRLLLRMPATGRVLVGGRRPPVHGWVPDVLEQVTRTVRMPGLPPSQAATLLRRHGIVSEERIDRLITRAQGSPLALVVSAEGDVAPGLPPAAHSEELIRRIAGAALQGLDQDVLHVAAIAAVLDEQMLADVLPDRDVAAAYSHLGSQTFVEQRSGRLVLHPLLAGAVRDRLDLEAPARQRVLTLRIASVLRDRALAARPGALPELAALVHDPYLRRGLGTAGVEHYYASPVRPEDHELVRSTLDDGLLTDPAVAEVMSTVLDAGFAVRTVAGACASLVTVRPATDPVDPADPFTAPLARFAHAAGIAADCVLTPLQLTLSTREHDPDLEAFRNAVALRRCGLANPRHDLVNQLGWREGEDAVMRSFGYAEVPALRRAIGELEVRTWHADSGPGGLVGMVHRVVLTEQGAGSTDPMGHGVELVSALESFHSDEVMASLDLAPRGHREPDAAKAARTVVRRSVSRILADRPELLELVERRYYEVGATHEDVIRQSFLSRRSYFRRLSEIRRLLHASS